MYTYSFIHFTVTLTVDIFVFVLPMSISVTNKIIIYFIVCNALLLKEMSTFYDSYLCGSFCSTDMQQKLLQGE